MGWGIAAALAGSAILGSVLGEKGQSEPEARQASNLTPEQAVLLKKMIAEIEPQIGKGVEPYPGTTVPSEEFMQDYYAGAEGFGEQPLYRKGGEAMEMGLSGKPVWDTDMDAAREYWKESFHDPAMTSFMKDVLPQLREDYAGTGAYDSGGRRRAETGAARRISTDLNAQLADIMWREQEAGRLAKERALERSLGTARQVPEYLGAPLAYKRDVGGLRTGFEADRLTEGKEKWQTKQPYNSPYMDMGFKAIGQQAVEPYMYEPPEKWYGTLGRTMTNLSGQAAGAYLGKKFG